MTNRIEDLSVITISNKPFRIPSTDPIRISNEPTIAPLIITAAGHIPYSSDKAIPWNYGVEVYYHAIKQDSRINKNKADVTSIAGSSKVTRTLRFFSPDISLPITTTTLVRITNDKSSANTRGKEKEGEPAGIEAPTKDTDAKEPSI